MRYITNQSTGKVVGRIFECSNVAQLCCLCEGQDLETILHIRNDVLITITAMVALQCWSMLVGNSRPGQLPGDFSSG